MEKKLSGNNVLIKDDGKVATILQTKSNIEFFVSSLDLDLISQYAWYVDKMHYYVKTHKCIGIDENGEKIFKVIYLHRLIMSQFYDIDDKNFHIDHIDRNPLNNVRENLRIVSIRENNLNKYRTDNSKSHLNGVNKSHWNDNYSAHLSVNKNTIYLGDFRTKYDAALVYDRYIYLCRPEIEYSCTNLYMGKIPQEELDKRGIKELSDIPFIASSKHGSNNYNGVIFDKHEHAWKVYIRDENGKQRSVKQSVRSE